MLSVTQKKDGFIAIGIMPGVEIIVHVARIEKGTVQLAIDCPRDFPILRSEIYTEQGGFKKEDFERAQREEHKPHRKSKPKADSGLGYRYSTPETKDAE